MRVVEIVPVKKVGCICPTYLGRGKTVKFGCVAIFLKMFLFSIVE